MEIVFVHAGSAPLPEHLIDNLLFLKKTTQKTPIKVISQAEYECLLPEDIRSDKRFTFLPIETLQEGLESLAFKERSMMPKDIMNGFWFHTSYRFFLILDYMRQHGATNVLHLESDVILLIDPIEIESIFVDFSDFAVTMDRIRAIPGIVWFKSVVAAEALAQFMNSNTAVTDMESIGTFVEQYYGFAKPLPTIPRDYAEGKGLPLNRYCDGIEQFGGIFDAAAIGQYIRGVHWINMAGNTRFFQNESSDLLLNDFRINYTKRADQLRIFLNAPCGDGSPVKVLSIHLHSKNLRRLLNESKKIIKIDEGSFFQNSTSLIKRVQGENDIENQSQYMGIKTISIDESISIIDLKQLLSQLCQSKLIVIQAIHLYWYIDFVLPYLNHKFSLCLDRTVDYSDCEHILRSNANIQSIYSTEHKVVTDLLTREVYVLGGPLTERSITDNAASSLSLILPDDVDELRLALDVAIASDRLRKETAQQDIDVDLLLTKLADYNSLLLLGRINAFDLVLESARLVNLNIFISKDLYKREHLGKELTPLCDESIRNPDIFYQFYIKSF